jgi:polyphenol oxidase
MILHEHEKYTVFFGGRDTDEEQIAQTYPHPLVLNQTHSDVVIEAGTKKKSVEADAHWTADSQKTLLIQTADCIPIMIYFPLADKVLAVHAGWRGVMKKIVTKSILAMNIDQADRPHVYIGPHIQKDSFEVEKDVALQILKAHEADLLSEFCFVKKPKYHIALSELVMREIAMLRLRPEVLQISDVDTKMDSNFFSFRNGDRGGRNLSLIVKK